MTEQSSPVTESLPPIAIVGAALLDDVQASVPASHKQFLLVQQAGYLVVTASRGQSAEHDLTGATLAVGEGFLGEAARTGKPQIRANLKYVPPGAPPLTDIENSLAAKSAICVPLVQPASGLALIAAYVCHGANIFVLEDLDKLAEVCASWADRLDDAAAHEESMRWLAQWLPAPEPAADYTVQDVEVLLTVFGVDLTTRNQALAHALKMDVGEFLRRDVRDVFKAPAEVEQKNAPAGQSGSRRRPWLQRRTRREPDPAPPDPEHLSEQDVGRVLSVFGVKVTTTDNTLSRALSQDLGSLLRKPAEEDD